MFEELNVNVEEEELDENVAENEEFIPVPEVGVDQYIDDDGNIQEVVEAYDPNVSFDDEEEVILDTTPNQTFKVDENMPPELKEQIEKFNRKSQNINSVISGQMDYVEEPSDETEEYEFSEEDTEENVNTPTIAEENVEVGNLF